MSAPEPVVTDYAVAPGEYLAEWLEDRGLGTDHAAEVLGLDAIRMRRVIDGRAAVNQELAIRLSVLTGIAPHVWVRHQQQYDADLHRLGRKRGPE